MNFWKEYQKINTLYKRDMQGTKNIIVGEFSDPSVEILKDLKWEATEKIDGTNISVAWNGEDIEFHGRTENADIPKHLLAKLELIFTTELLNKVFPKTESVNDLRVEIFGEGYGCKIQKGGNYISNDVDFILFDIRINGWWLLRDSLEDIAKQLNINIVPIIGEFTIKEAEELVSKGFKSTIAENKEYEAEGLVLKTKTGLLDRSGKRIIVKIKTVDYKNLKK